MLGHFNLILKSFILEKFGQAKWDAAIKSSKCASSYKKTAVYDDAVSMKLVDAAIRASGIKGLKKEEFLEMLGEHYLQYVRKMGHDELLRNLGANMLDFLANLDSVHAYCATEFRDMNAPSFFCDKNSSPENITLHYYSLRKGYHPFMIGIIKSAAKVFFRSNLLATLISQKTETVGGVNGTREHLIYSIRVTKITSADSDDGPPTFIAQTRKNAEKHILKSDIEHVIERLEMIRREQGEEALPLANKTKNVVASKWKALAKKGVVHSGFAPTYPPTLSISTQSFCDTFPYHMVFNEDLSILHSGVRIQKLMPSIRMGGAQMNEFFELVYPNFMDMTYTNFVKFINTPFAFKTQPDKMNEEWSHKPLLILRGQMIHVEKERVLLYICSPFVRCLKDLEDRGMFFAEIPIHDVTRDLILMDIAMSHKYGLGAGGFGSGYHGKNRNYGAVLGAYDDPMSASHDDSDKGDLAERLRRTEQALANEKHKTNQLLRSFLPRSTVDQILSGQTPDAGMFRDVTVLFSDVVAFASIISRCDANDVCSLLTELHTMFDRLCQIHDTFRVEAIGDAYMVVSGLPDPIDTHAQRIANVALGMIIASQDIDSPYNYGGKGGNTVQIRVGIHTGAVVGGIIGDKLPRFMVMGNTVNMASRMESHGIPGKIQISTSTYSALKDRGFKIESRGEIEVRGSGPMKTYILAGNERATDDEIMGRRREGGVQLIVVDESSSDGSRTPNNKVHPSNGNLSNGSNTRPTTAGSDYIPMIYSDSNKRRASPGSTRPQSKLRQI